MNNPRLQSGGKHKSLSAQGFSQMMQNKNACNHDNYRHFCFVRMKGLEPLRLAAPDPKSGSATNYDTSAAGRKDSRFYLCQHF
jgi:hypothetical protein